MKRTCLANLGFFYFVLVNKVNSKQTNKNKNKLQNISKKIFQNVLKKINQRINMEVSPLCICNSFKSNARKAKIKALTPNES